MYFVFQFYLGSGPLPADTVTPVSSLIYPGNSILPQVTKYHFPKLLTRPHAHSHEDATMCGGGQLKTVHFHLALICWICARQAAQQLQDQRYSNQSLESKRPISNNLFQDQRYSNNF